MKHESIELLSRYLKIDTTNPPGNEKRGVAFFSEILDREGISYSLYEPAVGRCSVRAVIPGSGEEDPIILLNHIDVVPATADEWRFDPFGGDVRDGYIHGRGALDMKGLAIMEFLAFLEIKRNGLNPTRDIIFLAVADEETDGTSGIRNLLENYPEDFKAGLILNEGGYITNELIPNRPVFMISSAEKGACWLNLKASGPAGHGSLPHGNNALEKLIRGLNRLLVEKHDPIITDIVAAFFKKIGENIVGLKPYVADGRSETLLDCLSEMNWLTRPHISAMVTNTISLNVMNAGMKTNVIPDQAEAELDIRLLPGQDPDEFVRQITRTINDQDIEISFFDKGFANSTSINNQFISVLEEAIHQKHPDAIVVPTLDFGNSDSRYFRENGTTAYGVNPILLTSKDLETIHGRDERISEENMVAGTSIYCSLLKGLCLK